MSNYFCLYCTEPRRRAAAVAYLKANAPKNGVIYKLYPNLAEMPQVFKDAHFGIRALASMPFASMMVTELWWILVSGV